MPLILHFLLTRDPTMQSCFRREFWWSRHWLHPSDLCCPAHVVLSGNDCLVPAHDVHEYLLEADRQRRLQSGTRSPTSVISGSSAVRPHTSPKTQQRTGGASPSGGLGSSDSVPPPSLEVELHSSWEHGFPVLLPWALPGKPRPHPHPHAPLTPPGMTHTQDQRLDPPSTARLPHGSPSPLTLSPRPSPSPSSSHLSHTPPPLVLPGLVSRTVELIDAAQPNHQPSHQRGADAGLTGAKPLATYSHRSGTSRKGRSSRR